VVSLLSAVERLSALQVYLCYVEEYPVILKNFYKFPCRYHPSFPPQSYKNFFMCHSEYGEAEHKYTWREMWNKLLLKLEHRNSKAFFYICCERSARNVRGSYFDFKYTYVSGDEQQMLWIFHRKCAAANVCFVVCFLVLFNVTLQMQNFIFGCV
jgi:hypothetical protein